MVKKNVKLNEKYSVEFDVVFKNCETGERDEVIETLIPFEKFLTHVDVMDRNGNLVARIKNKYVEEEEEEKNIKMLRKLLNIRQ
jgi:hypothetical protein